MGGVAGTEKYVMKREVLFVFEEAIRHKHSLERRLEEKRRGADEGADEGAVEDAEAEILRIRIEEAEFALNQLRILLGKI